MTYYAAPSSDVWPWAQAAEEAAASDTHASNDALAAPAATMDAAAEAEKEQQPSAHRLHTVRCPLLMVQPFPAAAAAAAASPSATLSAAQAAALVCGIIQHLIVQLRLTSEFVALHCIAPGALRWSCWRSNK